MILPTMVDLKVPKIDPWNAYQKHSPKIRRMSSISTMVLLGKQSCNDSFCAFFCIEGVVFRERASASFYLMDKIKLGNWLKYIDMCTRQLQLEMLQLTKFASFTVTSGPWHCVERIKSDKFKISQFFVCLFDKSKHDKEKFSND